MMGKSGEYCKVFLILFVCVLILGFKEQVLASPAKKSVMHLVQPSGQIFSARLKGDEKLNWITAETGEIIVKNTGGYWCYGKLTNSGLEASENRYKIDAKPASLPSEEQLMYWNRMKVSYEKRIDNKMSSIEESLNPSFQAAQNTLPKPISDRPRNLLVLLVEFSDISVKNTDSAWSNAFFGVNGQTVNNYYKEESKEKFYFNQVQENSGTSNDGVIRVRLNYSHPNTGGDVENDMNEKIIRDALSLADKNINFSALDVNKDGYITTDELDITAVTAGYEAAAGYESPSVWAHMSPGLSNVNLEGKKIISSYTEEGEIQSNHMATIGVLCHELGHTLGLPDLYDYDGSSLGVGGSSLMGSGNWGGYPAGATPVQLDPWSKNFLGFISPTVAVSSGIYTLNSDPSSYNVIKISTSDPKQYFLIENREFSGFDASLNELLSSGGIAIWHIDENVLDYNPYTVNDDENHKFVDLEEASEAVLNYSHLDKGYSGVFDDYFHLGGVTEFSDDSMPSSYLYGGRESGKMVEIIDSSSPSMKINVNLDNTGRNRGEIENTFVTNQSGIITIGGYALSKNGIGKIDVLVDGNVIGQAIYGLIREDVIKTFPQYMNGKSGYFFSFDTRKLTGGQHKISIRIYDKAGNQTLSKEKDFSIANSTSVSDEANVSQKIKGAANLYSIAYGNNSIVAVGGDGNIRTSSDGHKWILRDSGIKGNINKVVFLQGRFFALSYNTVKQIITSVDGVNWNVYKDDTNLGYRLTDIAYGNGRFVVSTSSNYVLTSSDGLTWKRETANHNTSLNGIQFAANRFYGISKDKIFTSMDGLSWNLVYTNTDNQLSNSSLKDIIYDSGKFIVVGSEGIIITSSDGINWLKMNSSENYWINLQGIAYNGSNFVIISDYYDVLESSDGITWKKNYLESYNALYGVTSANGMFYAIGPDSNIISSLNGKDWNQEFSGIDYSLRDIIYAENSNGGIYAAVGDEGTVMSSKNGGEWHEVPTNIDENVDLKAVAFGLDKFIAIGTKGSILVSNDLSNWTLALGISNAIDFSDVVFDSGRFVAVGNMGAIFYSKDGTNWIKAASNTSANLKTVCYGTDKFIAGGDGGVVLSSSDGVNWKMIYSGGNSDSITSIAYGNGIFIGIMNGHGAITSKDGGISFIESEPFPNWNYQYYSFSGIAFGNNRFLVVDPNKGLYSSKDGLNWSAADTNQGSSERTLTGVNFAEGKFIITGSFEEIFDCTFEPLLKNTSIDYLINDVPIYQNIALTFNKNIEGTDAFGNITLKDSRGINISCYLYVDDNNLNIAPKTLLSPGTSYTLRIPAFSIKDLTGNALNSDQIISFTTSKDKSIGDFYKDGNIDINDLALLARQYNTHRNRTGWDFTYDLNFDDVIDLFDLVLLSRWM